MTGAVSGPPTYVIVPVRDRLDLTQALVAQLGDQGGYESLLVFDNGSTDGTAAWLADQASLGTLEAIDATGWGLHQMWNAGVDCVRRRQAVCNIAILNNDLRLGPDFCRQLSVALRSDPELWVVSPSYDGEAFEGLRYVRSTYKNGGLAGFAFMVRGEIFPSITFDEDLRWWCGDDDLVAQVEAHGHRVGITGSTTVEHIDGGSQTIGYTRDVIVDLEHDVLHMYRKWGHT